MGCHSPTTLLFFFFFLQFFLSLNSVLLGIRVVVIHLLLLWEVVLGLLLLWAFFSFTIFAFILIYNFSSIVILLLLPQLSHHDLPKLAPFFCVRCFPWRYTSGFAFVRLLPNDRIGANKYALFCSFCTRVMIITLLFCTVAIMLLGDQFSDITQAMRNNSCSMVFKFLEIVAVIFTSWHPDNA